MDGVAFILTIILTGTTMEVPKDVTRVAVDGLQAKVKAGVNPLPCSSAALHLENLVTKDTLITVDTEVSGVTVPPLKHALSPPI